MKFWAEVALLFKKEVLTEWRSKYGLSAILLYVLATVFVVFLSFQKLEPETWNAMFWIILLFAGISAVLKSFVQENSARQLYYYTLVNPIALLLAKWAYNALLLMVLGLLCWLGLAFVAGNPVTDPGGFILAIVMAGLGFSTAFTFLSGIAIKAAQAATLMTLLCFPVIIPVILLLIRLSSYAIGLQEADELAGDLTLLLAIDLLLLALALVMYPLLWRD